MREFTIQLHSLQDVQEFVNIACTCPFQVTVGNESQRIDGKDFMGMFSLDLRGPLVLRLHGRPAPWLEDALREYGTPRPAEGD